MATFLICFATIFVCEMGDRTQILVMVLSSRFRRPWAILAGVTVASLASFGLSAWVGGAVAGWIPAAVLRWLVGLGFLGFAAWLLVPEKEEGVSQATRGGAFWATASAIFLAEFGDKAQLAVVACSARYNAPLLVTLGGTLGMVAADGLAIVFGERITSIIPMVWVRRAASALFLVLGVLVLMQR